MVQKVRWGERNVSGKAFFPEVECIQIVEFPSISLRNKSGHAGSSYCVLGFNSDSCVIPEMPLAGRKRRADRANEAV